MTKTILTLNDDTLIKIIRELRNQGIKGQISAVRSNRDLTITVKQELSAEQFTNIKKVLPPHLILKKRTESKK